MMKTSAYNKMFSTNDNVIRVALRKSILDKELARHRKSGYKAEIFEELGVQHGAARIDYAIINGIMCGYEIKSDRDTLDRLPEQVEEFSAIFDELTLVVGKRHLYQAIHEIPEWWGVMIAKEDTKDEVIIQAIREPSQNTMQKEISITRLLWREEALRILEQHNKADGMRHKPRELIYQRLVEAFASDFKTLKEHVSSALISREGWRSDPQLMTCGG